ncbi:MAG: sugar phosphate isomerase/epimerase family protein [Bacillota bacterium]
MNVELGINLGFAINKYLEPEEWTRIVHEELGLSNVQFVADLLNPFLPKDYVDEETARIKECAMKHRIKVRSVFTSAFTRVNHLMHPHEQARKIWLQWFKDLFFTASKLGAKTGGSHFGILTFASYQDEAKRKYLIEEGIRGWQELSFFAKDLGFDCLIFEPMSVPREMANTIEESLELMDRVNQDCGVPMRICLDIGHAPHPAQRDPYPWIERLGIFSPIIHIQQTVLHKSNHWPFTQEYNEQGIIHPEKVLEALAKSGVKETILMFEISHREHWDSDFRIIEDLKASVEYWKKYVW